jgi:hypothetical protein
VGTIHKPVERLPWHSSALRSNVPQTFVADAYALAAKNLRRAF